MGRNTGAGALPTTTTSGSTGNSALTPTMGVITPSAQNPYSGIFGTGRVLWFVASENWVPPAGITSCRARVWGTGGNGGSGAADTGYGGGGGGGFAMKVCAVTPGTAVPITIPAKGTTGTASFGSYCSATSGANGIGNNGAQTTVAGGTGIGGDINRTGGSGWPGVQGYANGGGGAANLLGNGGDSGFSGTSGGGGGTSFSNTGSIGQPAGSGFSGVAGRPGLNTSMAQTVGLPSTSVGSASLDWIGTGPGGSGGSSGIRGQDGVNGGGGGGTGFGGFPGGGSGGGGGADRPGAALVIVEY